MRHPIRRAATLLATTGILSASLTLLGPTPPATAQVADNAIYVTGDFWNTTNTPYDDGDEVLIYRPGSGIDQIFDGFNKTGTSFSMAPDPTTPSVTSTYAPTAGDFDGDGFDEILWYGPGTTIDYIWDFDPTVRGGQTSITLGATNATDYILTAGDFTGDGAEDIFWYRPNTQDEVLWDFAPSTTPGTFPRTDYTLANYTAGAGFVPLAGDFTGDGADDMIFYQTSTGNVSRWDFEIAPATPIRSSTAALGTAPANVTQAVTLDRRNDTRTDLFFYTAGATNDIYWDYNATGAKSTQTYNTNSIYTLTTGNYFNDNGNDILWAGASTVLWNYHTTTSLQNENLSLGGAFAAALETAEINAANGEPDAPFTVNVDLTTGDVTITE